MGLCLDSQLRLLIYVCSFLSNTTSFFLIMTLYYNLKSGSMIPSKFQMTYPKFH